MGIVAKHQIEQGYVDVIFPEHYAAFASDLKEMHRQRHRVFVERMDWEVNSDGLEERDNFDQLKPIYLLCRNGVGRLLGSLRLLPTTGPYMLPDVFGEILGDEPAPRSPYIWESSRFTIEMHDENMRSLAAVGRTTSLLFIAAVETGLALGWDEIISVYDIRIGRIMDRAGGKGLPLGRRTRVGKFTTEAGRWPVSHGLLEHLRQVAGIDGQVVGYGALPIPQPALSMAAE